MTRVPLVDLNDQIIGYKERDETTPQEVRRIAALWLTNSKGEILIAQRSLSKKHHPGRWSFACTGTVEEGETYEQAMRREIKEELGISDIEIILGPKFITKEFDGFKFFCQYFLATKDIPLEELRIDTTEVAAIRWIDSDELIRESEKYPDTFIVFVEKWREWIKEGKPF